MLLLAHPESAPREVLAPPALVALVVFALIMIVARGGTPLHRRRDRSRRPDDPVVAPLTEDLAGADLVGRALGVGLLVLALATGALGRPDQLRNLAPTLAVGVGWPFLLASSAVVGGVFAWLNPFDGLGRLVARFGAGEGEPAQDVRPAAIAAFAWVWYLTVPRAALEPATVAAVLGAYTVITVAGCLAVGRVRWLTGAEVFTLLFGWITRARRGQLDGWAAPRGTREVLAVLAGGLVAGQLRDTHLYDPLRTDSLSWLWQTLALLLIAGLVFAVLRSAERGGDAGTETAAMIWVVVGLGLALAFARNRVLTSLQLLPVLLSDPFGWGWDLFGTAGPRGIVASPLTEAGRVWTQVALLTAGGLAAAAVAARDDRPRPGGPGTAAGLVVWVGVLAFTSI